MNNMIESKIKGIADKVNLPEKDKGFINELLENNEFGVALETICGAVFEDKIKISKETYIEIEDLGKLMKMPPITWESLKDLVL